MGSSVVIEAVALDHVSRHFGAVRALDDVSLSIADGEFFSLLGPSGSGKTTCLRLIAGFDEPTSGQVSIYGQQASGIPPYDREVNTVFQDYALFPHMNIADNVGYGLMVRKVPRQQRLSRVREMLELVQLSGYESRRPAELSGGQRQRVALARALINHPRVLLLDEPLGALDLKLREQMQVELKTLQRRVGITFIYVTHDQQEALCMSDRLAVFKDGRVEQVGTPEGVYDEPATAFVAGFVGVSNLIPPEAAASITGTRRAFSIRPERLRFAAEDDNAASTYYALGRVSDRQYLGAAIRFLVRLDDGGDIYVLCQNERSYAGSRAAQAAERVRVCWHHDDMHWLGETD